ncbi:MAG: hypothetical protein FWG68_12035 [Defluviitaleaceae bacterium]|nr:hypothetical protein [Defluviitaleaceae bacterium]
MPVGRADNIRPYGDAYCRGGYYPPVFSFRFSLNVRRWTVAPTKTPPVPL